MRALDDREFVPCPGLGGSRRTGLEGLDPLGWLTVVEMVDYLATPAQMAAAERLDTQMIEIQHAAENKCRKIYKPDLPHSPPVKSIAIRQRSYMELISGTMARSATRPTS